METAKVNGDRIRQAREIREISQSDLADRTGVDQSFLSYVEGGLREPSADLCSRIAVATQFPIAFFKRDSGPEFPLGSLLFRRRDSLPSSERDKFRQLGRLAYEIFDEMASEFKVIDLTIPHLPSLAPHEAARVTRTAMGLSPETPITHLINKLERAGVFVLLLPRSIQKADGFSVWADTEPRRPIIILTGGWPGDRQRFTVAHELGHLVLHQAPIGTPAEMDHAADLFASELLLPSEGVLSDLQPPITLTKLAELKRKWGVAMQALSRRAESLGTISEGQRKYLDKQMGIKGWMRDEPVAIQAEKPRLFRKMAETLYGIPTDARRVAEIAAAPVRLAEEILSSHASKQDVMQRVPATHHIKPGQGERKIKVIQFTPRRRA